jgi:hypothetical protein
VPEPEEDLQRLTKSLEKLVKKNKMETLKRWGQEKCEYCGNQLETLFNEEGKNPIRVCIECERKSP